MTAPGKDPAEEDYLARLNTALGPFEESGYLDGPETFPTLHVIGVPRAGTTLAPQLLASYLDVGYINNLIAAFWKAPTVGIRLSRKLLCTGAESSFTSAFGRTDAIREPHEFGYFWRDLLEYPDLSDQGPQHDQRIDWARVRRVLTNMTYAFERPIVFKSFWLGMHVARMIGHLPRTCFVRVIRDPLDNALSLLRMRTEFHGSAQTWASMKPREYVDLRNRSVPEQLAGQVYYLQQMMAEQVAAAPRANVLEVRYEDLCAHPAAFVANVQQMLRDHGAEVALRRKVERSFKPRSPRESAAPGEITAIQAALAALQRRHEATSSS
jgi:hypothetical protein